MRHRRRRWYRARKAAKRAWQLAQANIVERTARRLRLHNEA
jgi:hypothetical protein